jgi:SUKH-4 immunity protein
MADRRLPPWPRFELVSISGSGLPAHLAARFRSLSVPSEQAICACTPADVLQAIVAPDGEELVILGSFPHGPLCLSPATGHVVDLVQDASGRVLRSQLLVNSSLAQYVQTVEQATILFPYYDEYDLDTATDAANRLREHLEPIDPPAWEIDSFWDTFYWDVTIGDYCTAEFAPPFGTDGPGVSEAG